LRKVEYAATFDKDCNTTARQAAEKIAPSIRNKVFKECEYPLLSMHYLVQVKSNMPRSKTYNLLPSLVNGNSKRTSRKRLRYGLRSSGITLVSNKAVIW
jgi:hypothetical protein